MTVAPLDAMSAYAAAQAFGCRGVPAGVDVDALFEVHQRVSPVAGSWAVAAFDEGAQRPCEVMRRGSDPFTGRTVAPPGCRGSVCLFGGGDA